MKTTQTVIRTIFNLAPLILMGWAATETAGVLHWLLLGWVGMNILIFAIVASKWAGERAA
ncbi:hypothetical protein ACIRON_02700 [Nocardioides sp. NPDC101246]|uniref:hypothetical protein n=1 Tax=Nocardioides sp. NPDC101246 TaxID=3364336 RepID=UPI0038286C9D